MPKRKTGDREAAGYGSQIFIRLDPEERKRWGAIAAKEVAFGGGLATWCRDIIRKHVERAERKEGK